MPRPVIRPIEDGDIAAITAIYNHYITTSIATFEEVEIDANEMRRRVAAVLDRPLPWLIAERDGEVLGYAYAMPWKPRVAYRHSVESTIYLAPGHLGQGIGFLLHGELFRQLRELDIHVIIGGISLPNDASVRLHETMGMHKVAHFEAVGFKFGKWIDVGYWQVTVE